MALKDTNRRTDNVGALSFRAEMLATEKELKSLRAIVVCKGNGSIPLRTK